MAQPVSAPHGMSAAQPTGRVATAIAWGAGGLGGLVLIGAAGLWFHYGTTVFFEMISAGVSACF